MSYPLLDKYIERLKEAIYENNSFKDYIKKDIHNFALIDCFLSVINRAGFTYDKKWLPIYESEKGHFVYNQYDPEERNEIDQLKELGLIQKLESYNVNGAYKVSVKGVFYNELDAKIDTPFVELLIQKLEKHHSSDKKSGINDHEKFLCYSLLLLGAVNDKNKVELTPDFFNEMNKYLPNLESSFIKKGLLTNQLITRIKRSKDNLFAGLLLKNDALPRSYSTIYHHKRSSWIYLDLSSMPKIQKMEELLFQDKDFNTKAKILTELEVQNRVSIDRILGTQHTDDRISDFKLVKNGLMN